MQNIIERIAKTKIVPVVKIDDLDTTIPIMNALYKGGIDIAEITYRTAVATDAIEIAVNRFPDMIIGAGTVTNISQAKEAISLGVKFLVSPGFDKQIAILCKDNNINYFGGCVTPTEIMTAIQFGQDIIKFFPASAMGGLPTIKALSAPFNNIMFMPTGGIGMDNIKEYLSFNKVIACGGSWMIKDDFIKNKQYEKIIDICKATLEIIK